MILLFTSGNVMLSESREKYAQIKINLSETSSKQIYLTVFFFVLLKKASCIVYFSQK